jgi:hypothetical protein
MTPATMSTMPPRAAGETSVLLTVEDHAAEDLAGDQRRSR